MSLQDNMAEFIRRIMAEKGKSLTEFAEELGISRNALYAYYTGGGNPTITTLAQIAERLHVDPAVLISNVPEQERREVADLLLSTIQCVSELPEEKRSRFPELFLEILKLWNKE